MYTLFVFFSYTSLEHLSGQFFSGGDFMEKNYGRVVFALKKEINNKFNLLRKLEGRPKTKILHEFINAELLKHGIDPDTLEPIKKEEK